MEGFKYFFSPWLCSPVASPPISPWFWEKLGHLKTVFLSKNGFPEFLLLTTKNNCRRFSGLTGDGDGPIAQSAMCYVSFDFYKTIYLDALYQEGKEI